MLRLHAVWMHLAWRGGATQELWKGRSSTLVCSSYRDIWLENTMAKDFHGFIRGPFFELLEGASMPAQCGGLRHRGADIALHMGRAHWQALRALRRSGFQLYTDLSAAFASVVRELALTSNRSEDAAAFIFAKFGLPPEAMDDLRGILAAPGSMEVIGVTGHLRLLIEQAHDATWFTTQGLDRPATSEAGSRPGDPLGDAFFTAAVLRVLRMV